VIWSLKTYL